MSFGTQCRRAGLDPREVINGPLRNTFKDAYATAFMEAIHKSFWDKARGSSDDFGEVWEPLRASTIALKKQMLGEIPGEESEFQKHRNKNGTMVKNGVIHYTVTSVPQISGIYSHRKLLSPEQRAVYANAATGQHRSTAARRGLAAVQHGTNVENAELINIRSGRLVAALAPVTASRGRLYQSGPDSSYSWRLYYGYPALRIDVTVPYAREVDAGDGEDRPERPILPDLRGELMIHREAVAIGVREVLRMNDNIKRERL